MDMTRGHRFSRRDSESPAVCIGCGDPITDELLPARECPCPAPDVRLSPDELVVAVKLPGWTGWLVTGAEVGAVADDRVADWTPLHPVSNEDGA